MSVPPVDDVVRPGQTISSTKFERRAGGKGANQAVAIARAGGAVSLVGAVGEDGAWLVRDLEGYGVSTVGISFVQVCHVPVCSPWNGTTLSLLARALSKRPDTDSHLLS
jgi:sugar/nucleoside kinase (ribokinase family)